MSADPTPRSGPDRRLLIGLAVGTVILAVLALFVMFGGDDDAPEVALESEEPTPSETAAPSETPTEAPTTEPPSETPSPSETPTEEPTAAGRQPTSSDVAAFAEANGPADKTATGDVTGDGTDEVVLARIRDESTLIIVGLWDGSEFQRVLRDEGGSAETIERLEIRDYNGVEGGEIVTEQVVGEAGRSISVWGSDGSGVARQNGKGGCWDGFHTYGVNGARIESGRISATCDASALPGEAQTRDIYRWRGDRWTYNRTTVTAG